jgi:transcriptional regulator of NAD metabolism
MTGAERRAEILRVLGEAGPGHPVSGEALGGRLGVSRQVIVQDVALLRAEGRAVASTNRGYSLGPAGPARRLVKVRHTADQIAEELDLVVDLGGRVDDIMVNHRTYGLVSAPLNVKSRRDARRFLDELAAGISSPLLTLTDGYHFHHISADTPEDLDEIVAALGEHGMLAELTDYEREALGGQGAPEARG